MDSPPAKGIVAGFNPLKPKVVRQAIVGFNTRERLKVIRQIAAHIARYFLKCYYVDSTRQSQQLHSYAKPTNNNEREYST